MTISEYQNKGYQVSNLTGQAVIDRAEADVMKAYILPILPSAVITNDVVKKAVMELTYLCLLRRSIVATRVGAKDKMLQNSQSASLSSQLAECATSCDLALENLRNLEGADRRAEICDFLMVYFKSNYFNM